MHTTTFAPIVVRDAIARSIAVVGLAGVALAAAGALIRTSDPRAWASAALLSSGAILAFVLSRTVGLPQGADDIGNWTEPLGMASLFVEGALVALSAGMLSSLSAFSQRRALVSAHG